jgi:GTP 3',8-cyclase
MIGHWHGMSRQKAEAVRDPLLRRAHRKLRISVTDRCSFRCEYCVPAEEVPLLPREEILSFEEIERLVVDCAVPLGISKLRLTGGDPLVRRGLPGLISRLRRAPGVERLGLTTNADRLAGKAQELKRAGLDAVNVSLDTLRRERFLSMARVDRLDAVLKGIDAASSAGFESLKLNCVLIRGVNDDEIGDLAAYGVERGYEVRFIELMPFGKGFGRERVISSEEVLAAVDERLGLLDAEALVPGETARTFSLRGGGRIGLISTVSEPFCSHCERLRLTADGRLLACLFATEGVDMRALLRGGAGPEELREAVREALRGKGVGPMDKSEHAAAASGPACPSMKVVGG